MSFRPLPKIMNISQFTHKSKESFLYLCNAITFQVPCSSDSPSLVAIVTSAAPPTSAPLDQEVIRSRIASKRMTRPCIPGKLILSAILPLRRRLYVGSQGIVYCSLSPGRFLGGVCLQSKQDYMAT